MINLIMAIVLGTIIGTLAGLLIITRRNLNEVYNAYLILSNDYEEVATKLDSYKEVDIISAPEIEITEEMDKDFRETFGDMYEDFRKDYIESAERVIAKHEDIIRQAVDTLQAEGLINKRLTIELIDDKDNSYCRTTTVNGQQYNRKICVSYNFRDNGFLMDYINKVYGLNLNNESLRLFVFLHEFGHYVDSTLDHEEGYQEKNQELYQVVSTMKNTKEQQLAYRLIPNELFADKWAVNFIKKHYPQYC